ncbi:hypothetical protein PGQ11_008148 [Apiospora arundinis]|uniref:Uncharacterized protein n=1 Tax=Apiospora arundinis TaxID=335852 RepID=A0ABR2IF58_9PEZI
MPNNPPPWADGPASYESARVHHHDHKSIIPPACLMTLLCVQGWEDPMPNYPLAQLYSEPLSFSLAGPELPTYKAAVYLGGSTMSSPNRET